MGAVIPHHATWVRFPRFVGDAAMQLPVLRLLREIGVGPIVVWGPKLTVGLVADTWFCDAALPDEGKPGPLAMARIPPREGMSPADAGLRTLRGSLRVAQASRARGTPPMPIRPGPV